MKKYILITLFLLFVKNGTFAQPYYFRHYQVEDGLSHSSVICTLQDQRGFLWFGTKDGLNRFDGYSFKIFRSNPDDTTSIGNNIIQTLYEDKGELWIGTDKGLYQYDSRTENFRLLKVTVNNSIRDITKDDSGNLWFISGYTLNKYNEKNQLLQSYDVNEHFYATSICQTSDSQLWFSSALGTIHHYDPVHDAFTAYNVFKDSEKTSSYWIEKVYSADNKHILIGTQSQGVKIFNIKSETYKDVMPYDFDHSELFVRDFVKSNENEYWMATESGVFIYNFITERITNLKKNYNSPYAISDNAIYSLCKDKEGGIWAGTYFGGVNYYPKQYTSFQKYFPKTGENSISGNAVREIQEDKYGNLWIGTEDAGLNKLNPKTGLFTHYGVAEGLSHYNIHGLFVREDELWIGTFHHGLDVMDIRTGKIIRHYGSGDAAGMLKSNFIYSIIQTRKGKTIVGTTSGLYEYNSDQDTFSVPPGVGDTYPYTTTILEDHLGVIWAGTFREGIYYYDPTTGDKGYYKNDPENKSSLSSNSITGIFEDSQQNLWFCTENGLNKFNRKNQDFKLYNTHNGFPSDVMYRMLEDEQKNLWISTSKGLVRFNLLTEDIKIYTKAHGLLNDQFNYSSSHKDEEGNMYFGSVSGLIKFNPKEFVSNTYVPPVCITGIQVNNQELPVNKQSSPLKQSIIYTDKVTLSHDQSSFSLNFAALSYTAPTMTEYMYKMNGLDQNWIYLKTNRKVYFTELAPGEYTFMVKAANSSGKWKEKATMLKIEILPPFWASGSAYALYICLGSLILFFFIRNYHQQTEKKNRRKLNLLENEKEKEVYQAKIEFFTNVAHEIRTPLTLIKGPLESVMKSAVGKQELKENLLIMEKNTDRLLDLTNQLLDFRKTEIKGFSLTFVKADINLLLQETYTRFKLAAEQKQLQFDIEVPAKPLHAFVDPEAVIKILSNLFNNAVKYGEKYASVRLLPFNTKEDSVFTVIVKNDGPVVPVALREKIFQPFFRLEEDENKTGTGIGLPLARSLSELHKGTLEADISNTALNVFVLTLPVHQEREFKLFNEEPEGTEQEMGVPEENTATAKPAILLVEDNKEMLEFIAGALNKEYAVIKTSNGVKALEVLAAQSVQLVVSDIMMPLMDGFELCKHIKTNLENSHIPVVLLTAK